MLCWGELKSLRAQSYACNFQDMWKWKSARPTTSRKAGYAPDWLDKWTVIHHAIIQQSLNVIDSSQNKHIFGFTMGQHDEFCLLPRIFNLQTRTKRKNTTERWKSSEHLRHTSVNLSLNPLHLIWTNLGFWKLSTYPSPKLTLTLTSHLGQMLA